MTSARIIKIIEQGERQVDGQKLPFQTLELALDQPTNGQTTLTLTRSASPQFNFQLYEVGDKVWLEQSTTQQTQQTTTQWVIADYNRHEPLLMLAILFGVMVVGIGRLRGLFSLVALTISFLVITFLTVPLMAGGWNPILISTLTALIILPINFYLSHGWKIKTHLALASTIVALLITSLLAQTFIQLTHLSGMSSEEASFLMVENPGLINFQSLILAAVIVGALGILDDMTVSQTSVVFELKAANPNLKWHDLYNRGMRIGRDHISSMVNTLILVYAGAALPLLLMLSNNPRPLGEMVNLEIFAEEIIKTLTGSIGLIFAAPLATILAALAVCHTKITAEMILKELHSHHH